jgi:hypothetical protein
MQSSDVAANCLVKIAHRAAAAHRSVRRCRAIEPPIFCAPEPFRVSRLGQACKTIEPADPKVARRCRYDQHRGQKTNLTVEGSLVTGLVRSVMEVKSSNPTCWTITVVAKPSLAA